MSTQVLKMLGHVARIERYPEVRCRLDPDHLDSFWNAPAVVVSEALRRAIAAGPVAEGDLTQAYLDRGELRALQLLPAEQVGNIDLTAEFAQWQSKVSAARHKVQDRAAICDREGVPCPDPQRPTWAAKVQALEDDMEMYSDYPGCQMTLMERCLHDLDQSLREEKSRIIQRIDQLGDQLRERSVHLEQAVVDSISSYLQQASTRMQTDDFVVGCRRLRQAETLLRGTRLSHEGFSTNRRVLPRRPMVQSPQDSQSPFRRLRQVAEQMDTRGTSDPWRELVQDATIRHEVLEETGFVNLHRRSQEHSKYFKALRVWLGLQDDRKQLLPSMPRLVQNSNFWATAGGGARAQFVFTQPWQGAPFYEDQEGKPRVLAIVRLSVDEADWKKENLIRQMIDRSVSDLMTHARDGESEHERRFASSGLVIVLLPGAALSREGYRKFATNARLEGAADIRERTAFVDDLDLLRLVPLEPDQRLRGLLELVLPRFSMASQRTYFGSNAVAPRMFFGREQEMNDLDTVASVVFSGRKIGKSSLLRHQVERCMQRPGHRAIWISCAGVAPWHSWRVLEEIAQRIQSLLGLMGEQVAWQPESALTVRPESSEFAAVLERVKARFSLLLNEAVPKLRQHGVSRLFLLLDEADGFARAEWIENSGAAEASARTSVSWCLRDHENEQKGFMRIVFAGYDELGRKENLCHSAFGNWGKTLTLGPLDEPASLRLITEPLAALGILVNPDTADLILDYTSGHASLIQSFCARLITVIAEKGQSWPLEDVEVDYQDIRQVGDNSRFKEDMAETLGMNLGIARTYPLELVFLGLVSPTGFGKGRRLSMEGFTVSEAWCQFEGSPNDIRDFDPTTLEVVLDLLIQLGLLESISVSELKKYRFRARHYVSHLRTQNSFRDRLARSLQEWNNQQLRQPTDVMPRHVWSLAEEKLASLYNDEHQVAVVCGLRGSGREFLANALGLGACTINTRRSGWESELKAAYNRECERIVVLDLDSQYSWAQIREYLIGHPTGSAPLRWIAGPRIAWEAFDDLETLLEMDLFGMGPLTPAELDGWVARRMGDLPFQSPAGAAIRDMDKMEILNITGGLLPVMEFMREFFEHGLPDPFGAQEATKFQRSLLDRSVHAGNLAKTLTTGMPAVFRRAVHLLYSVCHAAGQSIYSRGDLDSLRDLYADDLGEWSDATAWQRMLDSATALGFVQPAKSAGQYLVPHDSVLGLLLRHHALSDAK